MGAISLGEAVVVGGGAEMQLADGGAIVSRGARRHAQVGTRPS